MATNILCENYNISQEQVFYSERISHIHFVFKRNEIYTWFTLNYANADYLKIWVNLIYIPDM